MIVPPHDEIYAGAYRLRAGAPHGALVSTAAAEARPRPVPRLPARRLPSPVPVFVNRELAIESAAASLTGGRPVEIFGGEGAGKTALLIHLAHRLAAMPHRAGLVVLSARGASLEDVVQDVFEALFEASGRMKVSAAGLRELAPEGAFVFLDDVELEPQSVLALVAAAPGCAVAMASPERRLWGDGRSGHLEGLDAETAVALFERRLGRPLQGGERERVRSLAAALVGRPLAIVLAAGLAREERLPPEEIERRLQAEGSMEGVAVAALAGDDLRTAAGLAALGGRAAAADDVAAIAAAGDARAALEALVRRGIVAASGGRFGMSATLAAETARRVDLEEWERRAAARYRAEAPRRAGDTEWVVAERGPLLEVLERAAAARHWQDVFAIAGAVEGAFALSGRWGAWGRVLDLALQAARHMDTPAGEAWALHQRGTRALCLGAADSARDDLKDALVIRETLNDTEGSAATRNNLEHLPGGGTPVAAAQAASAPAPVPQAASPWFFLALALAAVAVMTIIVLAILGRGDATDDPFVVVGGAEIAYGTFPVGVAADPRVIMIENHSDEPARVRAVRLEGDAAGDFVVIRDDCTGHALAPGAGCAILAAFVPASSGARLARLVVAGDDRSRQVTLTGVGGAAAEESDDALAAASEVAPARVDFGSQAAGTTGGPVPITFVNRGAGRSRPVVRLDAGPQREFAVAEDRCTNAVVPPGQACVVEVEFRPDGEGLRGAVLSVRDAVTNAAWTVALSGMGTATAAEAPAGDASAETSPAAAGPYPLASPDRIAFGVQRPETRSPVQSIVLENGSSVDLRITTVRIAGIDAASFVLSSDRCSGSIVRPGGRCSVDVWFQPADAGAREASLVVRDGAGGVAREVVLTGTGG
jgi:hypothetical protein